MRGICSLLLTLLLLAGVAMAEPSPEYQFTDDQGVIHSMSFLPGGDILKIGSYGREMPDGSYADTTIARTRPNGSEVWAINMPQSEIGGSAVTPLSDGRYMISHVMGEDDLSVFFIDAEDGIAGEAMRLRDQRFFAIEGGIIALDQSLGADSIRLRWLDLNGQEIFYKDYAFEKPQEMEVHLLEVGDSLYLLAQYYRTTKGLANSLTKLTRGGLIQWKQTYDDGAYPFMYMLHPDGEGGVLLLGSNGMYDDTTSYPYTARRIDPEGNIVWEKEIEVGEWWIRRDTPTSDGIRMIWENDDVFQFATLDREGELTKEPARVKPHISLENADCMVAGYAADETGQMWVYYNMIWDMGERVKPFIQPLDAFAIQGENP